jgi:hypothetical protein
LAVTVISPGPDGSVCTKRYAMHSSAGDGDYARKLGNSHRHSATYVAVIAELAVSIYAPRPHRAVRCKSQAMMGPRGDANYVA